jgi:transposase-like protein
LETPDEPEPPRERVEVTMAAKKKRQSYTKEQREAVLADVPTMGVSATARKHGVPQTSVSGWLRARSREGLTVAPPPTPVTPTPGETPMATRTLSSRVAKTYTPSQKAVVLEDAAKDGVTTRRRNTASAASRSTTGSAA